MRAGWLATIGCVCLSVTTLAQERRESREPATDEIEHAIVFELGVAGDLEQSAGVVHNGAAFAFEVTPIEHWLELEIGTTALAADGGLETPLDILAKKPWRLSRRIEFMVGLGPELIHATGPQAGTFWGLEGVLDFMFWPTRRVGWYIEPGYEITFRDGARRHGIGMSVGVLFGR